MALIVIGNITLMCHWEEKNTGNQWCTNVSIARHISISEKLKCENMNGLELIKYGSFHDKM